FRSEKEQQFGADGLLEGGLPRGFGGAGHVRLLCLRSRSVGVTGRRARPLRAVLPSGMSGRGLPTLRGCDADRNGPLSLRHRRGMCRAGTPDRTWNTPEVRVLGVDRGPSASGALQNPLVGRHPPGTVDSFRRRAFRGDADGGRPVEVPVRAEDRTDWPLPTRPESPDRV